MNQHNEKDLLDQIKNLTLQYNSRVTPRRQVQIQKPEDAFQVLMQNRETNMNTSPLPINSRPRPAEMPNQANNQEEKENKENTGTKRPKSYRKYTVEEKRDLLAQTMSPNQTNGTISRVEGVPKSNLDRWKASLDQKPQTFGQDQRKTKNGRKVKFPELDDHLQRWFQRLRASKVAVSGLMVTEEAQKYINIHKLEGIALSHGWLEKLFKRLGIVRRKVTKVSQKPARLFEAEIKKFVCLITEYRFDGPYYPNQIANMDEVPLLFDFTPDTTLDYKGVRQVDVRTTNKHKVRATLVLCCRADGFRFPPMLIFKENSGVLPQKIKEAYDPTKIVLKANKSGWMTTEVLEEWVTEVWEPNLDDDTSYLLIWDSFSCHKNSKIIENLLVTHNTVVALIPGGCTSVLQPLDVGVNKPLKDRIRKNFQEWSIKKLTDTSGKSETKSGYVKGPDREDLINPLPGQKMLNKNRSHFC